MRPVVVIAEHPSLTVGFASVAVNVARQLRDRDWQVQYLGVGPPARTEEAWPFPVYVDLDIGGVADRLVGLAPLSPAVVFFGRAPHLAEIEDVLRRSGVRRHFDITFYAAVDYTPAPEPVAAIADVVDRIVPSTYFGAAALGVPTCDPIPHGVDTSVFRPLSGSARRDARASELGVTDELVIGYFGRNTRHKRPDLAIRAFAHLATGTHATCSNCSALGVAELDTSGRFRMPSTCRRCRSMALTPGTPHPDCRLFMHTELSDAPARRISGGFDLPLLARRLGVTDRVMFDRSLDVGHGIPVERLAARMAAVDIHLLLCDGGGWELTVLETASCGVPNVVTDHAAPAEYAGPFSRLIPVADQLFQSSGIAGVADLDEAVSALVDLASDPGAREELGGAGPAVADTYRWDVVGAHWHDLLTRVVA